MHTLKYNVVALSAQRASLVALTVDYLNWLSTGTRAALGRPLESMAGMSIPEYAEKMADEIFCGTPQRSVFYLVETHGELAAMIGLPGVRICHLEAGWWRCWMPVRSCIRHCACSGAADSKVANRIRKSPYRRNCMRPGCSWNVT